MASSRFPSGARAVARPRHTQGLRSTPWILAKGSGVFSMQYIEAAHCNILPKLLSSPLSICSFCDDSIFISLLIKIKGGIALGICTLARQIYFARQPAETAANDDAGSWCRGLTCFPVTEEIAGSNPVEPAKIKVSSFMMGLFLD